MIILGTNSIKDTGFNVANSLRFNDGSSDNLSRTQESSANSQIFTYSTWVKRSGLTGVKQEMASGGSASTDFDMFYFDTSERLSYYSKTSNSENLDLATTRVFRDLSAWYHIVLSVDTTQGTASNRVKLYVNGVLETSYAVGTYPSVNTNLFLNKASQSQRIGRQAYFAGDFFDGYMSETVLIDGQQLAPTSFGEFDEDSGIWKPIDVSGLTFGTNGFYLDFEDSSALGADVSGNSNNFTVNNLTAIDQSTDTCTNNFCTLNALNPVSQSNSQLSEGNLKLTNVGSQYFSRTGNIAVTSGKWYAEVKITQLGGESQVGIIDITKATGDSWYANAIERAYVYLQNGYRYSNDSGGSWGANSYTTGDIIGVAMDLDNNKVYVSKNGTWQNSGDPTSGATGTGAMYSITDGYDYTFVSTTLDSGTDPVHEWNFGSPSFSISSGNTDGNGYGNFEYAVPANYYSLNTKNLAEYG